jgi:hypothetical protein
MYPFFFRKEVASIFFGRPMQHINPMGKVKDVFPAVMSSSLCKGSEGVVFPIAVKAVKDGKDNPVDTVDVDKTDHRPSPATYFHKTTFDHVASCADAEGRQRPTTAPAGLAPAVKPSQDRQTASAAQTAGRRPAPT